MFVPVSSVSGIGEYMRSTIIATYFQQNNPNVEIHFILSKQVPYAKDCQFNVHYTDKSPTLCTEQVNEVLSKLQPEVVVFDASGRAKQFKHAKTLGAKVVFISQHARKRAKSLTLQRIRSVDIHWVAQPELSIAELSRWQKTKIKLLSAAKPEYLGCLFLPPQTHQVEQTLAHYGLVKQSYVLFTTGSGGHVIENEQAAAVFYELAQFATKNCGKKCVFIAGANYKGKLPASTENLIVIKELDNASFIGLLGNAEFSVISGGGSLLQAISLSVPTLSIAIGKDQYKRIEFCLKAGLTESVSTNRNALFDGFKKIIKPGALNAQKSALKQSPITNGIYSTECQIRQLLN